MRIKKTIDSHNLSLDAKLIATKAELADRNQHLAMVIQDLETARGDLAKRNQRIKDYEAHVNALNDYIGKQNDIISKLTSRCNSLASIQDIGIIITPTRTRLEQ